MAVVTISRELGSRGTRIAEAVGAVLQAACVDKQVLAEMARRAGVSVDVIVEAEERLVSRPRVISPEMQAFFSADPARRSRPMDQATYVRQMSEAIRALADQDNIVLIGRGAQMILADHPRALHVHLYAPLDVRARRIQRRRNLANPDAARRIVQEADARRHDWFRRFFPGTDWKDPRHYHLLINTSRIPEDLAATMIVHAAEAAPPD